jgi:hypothetical protein
MKRNFALNIIFIAIFIVFLILSLIIDFFFFIPIICFLPFSFRTIKKSKDYYEETTSQNSSSRNYKKLELRYCQKCGGEITESIAAYCYHCGEKLNNR